MAKEQHGELRLKGTGKGMDITFYELNGKFFWRKKSSLTKERWLNDPAFEKSRQAAAAFGEASALAKLVHRQLPRGQKKTHLIGKLTGMAGTLLKSGISAEAVIQALKVDFS